VKLADAIKVVKQFRRYHYRNCKRSHPLGAFIRHVLIPHVTVAEFDQAVAAQKNSMGRMVWVAIGDLKTTQRCLRYHSLLYQLRRHPLKKVPIVVRLASGKYVIWDGNHRATSAIMLGRRRVKCLMVGSIKA
jgi:hypothetical protein